LRLWNEQDRAGQEGSDERKGWVERKDVDKKVRELEIGVTR